jgi:hypothetical protein
VAQSSELDVKDASLVLAHTADTDGVATAEITVKARLRSVGLVIAEDLDGGFRCRGAPESLGFALVLAQSFADLLS